MLTIPGHLARTILRGCSLMFMVSYSALFVHAQQSRFDIWKGDDIIGTVLARKTVSHDRILYLMTSFSEFDLVWKQVVRSMVSTEYQNGSLATCHSNMRVNGHIRDSSNFVPKDPNALCYVHPDEHFTHEGRVVWTTARMYFEEPRDQSSVFVESVLRYCPLQPLGNGRYRLTLPDNKVNLYSYQDGQLDEIHVDRSFFDLVFKRDKR